MTHRSQIETRLMPSANRILRQPAYRKGTGWRNDYLKEIMKYNHAVYKKSWRVRRRARTAWG
jgi:hypothetical protein